MHLSRRELVVDSFAGGGGASTGIEQAIGRPIDIAINHSPEAIAMHEANHPRTRHYCESVWDVDPVAACGGRPVGLAWFSPDCTHFSKAKGGKPRSKEIRGLAWIVIRWARAVAPRVILLENVEEFEGWGPIDDDGQPIRHRAGETFGEWCSELRSLGYELEFRTLVAADYGAPTTRKRLFLIARNDGQPIVWPEPSHGKGRAHPWRAASEIVDWSLPCPSIFGRRKPLADATLRRIAVGVRRYVLDAARPFVVKYYGTSTGRAIHEPLSTVTAGGIHHALVAPTLVQTGYGEREGQAPRALDISKPLGTVVAGGAKHALVAALITKHYGGMVGHAPTTTLGTITTQDHHAVTTATLSRAPSSRAPKVRALLDRFPGIPARGETAVASLPPCDGLVRVAGEVYEIADIGMRMFAPHELFAAQGFPRDYVIDPVFDGKPLTKTKQIALAGNSVCPQLSRALVEANVYQQAEAAE